MPDQPSPDHVPAKTTPPPIVGPPDDFLDANPEYRQHVFWSEEHKNWGMPGWVGNALSRWQLARLRPAPDHEAPEERAGREGRN
jgi:hypothetical protein